MIYMKWWRKRTPEKGAAALVGLQAAAVAATVKRKMLLLVGYSCVFACVYLLNIFVF